MTCKAAPFVLVSLAILAATATFGQGGDSGQNASFLRGADGKWRPVATQTKQGRITVSIRPADVGDGKALLVIAKPSWMVLEDYDPPVLKALNLNGQPVPSANGVASVVLPGTAGSVLSVSVADALNPIDGANARLSMSPPIPGATIDTKALKPHAKSGTLAIRLPDLPSGTYRGTLEIPDMSPAGNTLSIPLAISVPGFSASADKQTIRVAGNGAGYTISGAPQAFVRVGDDGPPLFLTSQVAGEYLYVRQITGFESLPPTAGQTPGEKSARVTAAIGTSDGKPLNVKADLQFDVMVRPDSPCLFITSRTMNNAADGEVYCFWGWLPGNGFVTAKGPQDWKTQYADIGPVGWVFLPSPDPGKPGIGVISPMDFGESRFSTLLLYTVPQRTATKVGGAVETRLAIMPARSADEVKAQAARIKW